MHATTLIIIPTLLVNGMINLHCEFDMTWHIRVQVYYTLIR